MPIIFPDHIIVTEQEVDCTHLSGERKEFIINFTKRLIALYKEGGNARQIYAIAGPSGSGKSYLSVLAQEVGKQIDESVSIVPVSIDAYHFPNEYLSQTKAGGGGEEEERGESLRTLKDVKGRYDTYDVPALLRDLEEFKSGSAVRFPLYSRRLHEPIQGEIKVPEGPAIVLIEGLWLLYPGAEWKDLPALYDHSYFLDDTPEALRERTISRHEIGGRERGDAERMYDESDAKNRALVLETKTYADEQLFWPKV